MVLSACRERASYQVGTECIAAHAARRGTSGKIHILSNRRPIVAVGRLATYGRQQRRTVRLGDAPLVERSLRRPLSGMPTIRSELPAYLLCVIVKFVKWNF